MAHRCLGIVETFQPFVEVYATPADGFQRRIGNTSRFHVCMKRVIVHVTGATFRMGHHHNLIHSQLKNSYNEAAHGRIERRNDQASGVLNELSIAIFET